MADEPQYASTGDFTTGKRKYGDSTTPPPPPSTRRQTGFSAPIIHSQSPDSGPAYNSVPAPVDEIELAKQRAQEIAARLFNNAEAKRPRFENGAGGGGYDSNDSKGFSSGPADYGQKPYMSTQSATSAYGYGSYGSSGKKIDIPNGRVGVIIGKGGETIKYLQLQSGAKIQVTRDMDSDPHSLTRTVELTGSSEAVEKAEQLIKDVLAEAESGGSGIVSRRLPGQQGGAEQFVMQVPNNKVGLVIGKGGETIKSMQASSGARIQVIPLHLPPGDTSTERTVQIDGSSDQIEAAKQLVNEVISEHSDNRRHLEAMDCSSSRHPEFHYKTEFQSHEPEFDYLKSLEIEEKINQIRWCHTANCAMFLLSTNNKTIKCWKVQEKKIKKICHMNIDPHKVTSNGFLTASNSNVPTISKPHTSNGGIIDKNSSCMNNNISLPSLHLPTVISLETNPVARCRRTFAHAHDFNINSISNNSDGETFISADDLRINLWNLEINKQSFNIVDVKPANMEDLTEVITAAEFHPSYCHMLAYSSSKGSIRLLDLRQSALCDNHTKLLEAHVAPGSRSFFTDIISSISDIKFAKGGRYILSRDYMTLKLWDINMDSGPVSTFQVHEYLRPKLCDMYENDSIFDKFDCCLNGDGQMAATGSYSNLFRIFGCSVGNTEETTLEATKNPTRRQIQTPSRFPRSPGTLPRVSRRGSDNSGIDINGSTYNFSTKLLHLAWHPNNNFIACAASNSLYMYYA